MEKSASSKLPPSRVEQKKLMNFGPLTTTVSWLMSTYPKSTLRVLRMLMRLSSGHVTLLRGECEPLKLSPQSDLGRRTDSRWALLQISSFRYVFCAISNYLNRPIFYGVIQKVIVAQFF